MLKIPIQFDDLLNLVEQLSDEEKQRLRAKLDTTLMPVRQQGKRIPGLHAGMIWVSDDFDDPLPDEFWLGEDASPMQ